MLQMLVWAVFLRDASVRWRERLHGVHVNVRVMQEDDTLSAVKDTLDDSAQYTTQKAKAKQNRATKRASTNKLTHDVMWRDAKA
jgi:hypothetical protein